MSRISRQQMKRNEVAETVGSVVEYSRSHTRTLLYGAIAALAVVLVAAGLMISNRQRAERAASALATAMAVENDPAAAREGFLGVIERYPQSDAADVARLYLGDLAADEGDFGRAQELWREVASAQAGTALGLQAQHNLWEIARAEGRHDELIADLRSQLEAAGGPARPDQLLYQLGLTLEARGSVEEAGETYRRLLDEHPDSVLGGFAEERATRLGADAAGIG